MNDIFWRNNGITDTNKLATEVMIRNFTYTNLTICLTELTCNGEQTGIYALTDGWVINGTVSDGTTDIFIPWIIGLPD